jgi:CheY-like chemotaxis protein
MSDRTLDGCRVLVVEDEFMLADEIANELDDAGAVVLGPVGSLAGAITLIKTAAHIDGAILDLNLGGEMTFPAAALLAERGVPFVFTTGYDPSMIQSCFEHVARCEKPVNMKRVAEIIGRVIRG